MELTNNNFKRQMETTDFQQAENKELIFSVADELPYLRHDDVFGDYYEVLEISDQAIDTTRLAKNMPFLKDHIHQQQLGAVKKFWIQDRKLYVSVRFSRSRFAQSIKEDIIDLIRQNTSIGYYVNQFIKDGAIDGIPVLRAVSWTPYECSSVSVPASVFVGYNRSIEVKDQKGADMKNEQRNQDASNDVAAEKDLELETKEANVELENKDLAGEDLETKSEEAAEVEEETGKEEQEEKQLKEDVCPECGKDPCECDKTEEQTTEEEKACGGNKPEEKALEITKDAIAEALTKQFEAEATEIRSLGELTGEHDKAEEFITQKRSLSQFKDYLKNKNSVKSQNSIQDENKMNRKYFSIVHAIRNAGNLNKGNLAEDYETLTVNENKRALNINDADIVLTNNELYQRALGPTSGKGAELIATDYLPGEFVPFDRPQLTIDKVGSYTIPSNGNPVSFAQCISGATASMYGLDGELSAGDMDFVLKTLTPHKAGVNIPIPYSLLLEGRPDIDALVQADVVNALYQKRDEQVWTGTGANNQVLGIESLTGINIITGVSLSAGAAWGGMLSAVGAIRKKNIFSENISFVMNTDTYVTLKQTVKNKDNCMAGFIIGDDDRIGKYPVFVNNAVSANTILVGCGEYIAVSDFRGIGILVDPYTYSNKQALKVTAWAAFDMVLRNLGSWTKVILTA